MDFLVETSARHCHLSEADLATLFGEGAKLTHMRDLSQPGQFACNERIEIVGPKASMKNVIILGPTRPSTQVEVSATDARILGLKPPIRESGDIAGSEAVKIVGPKGEVELKEGLIIAKRHIHTTPDDAVKLGVEDKQVVKVKIGTDQRALIFDDVVVRVNPNFATAMHIDTDESNAANATGEVRGEIL